MITVSGIGSGLDVNSLVDQLVAAEGDPVATRLDLQEAELQAKISSYGSLKSALSDLQGSISALSSLTVFNAKSVTLSNTERLTASASSIANTGSYSIEVSQLAQSHSLVTPASDAFTAVSDIIGTGTLTFRFGTTDYDPGSDTYNSFTVNADRPSEQVEITDGSLQGIRDAINNADIGVTASLINDGSGFRLLMSSDSSGADNSMEITVAEDGGSPTNTDTDGLSKLAFSSAADNLDQTIAGQDASIDINGLSISRESNNITGAIHGVTLDLLSAKIGEPVQLTIGQDTSGTVTGVQEFVTSYNTLIELIDSFAGFNVETGEAGVLLGDSTLRSITNQLRNLISQAVPGLSSSKYNSLAAIGISTQALNSENEDGSISLAGGLNLDTSLLQQALDEDPQAVGSLFAVGGTTTDSLVNYVDFTSTTSAGTYSVEVSQLATQGDYAGTGGITSLTLDPSNKTFALKVDGVQSATITLTEGTYDNDTLLADLASEMQGAINADATLLAAGVTVNVSYDTSNDKFVISSNQYGSNSTVNITSTNATLGLESGVSSDGVNVAGKIGGVSAIGSGRFLTGTGSANGLQLEVTGGAIGLRGSIVFSRGFADQMNDLLDGLLSNDNIIDTRISGARSSIDNIENQRISLADRLEALETRLRAQFTALDILMAELQNTSEFLIQQLANLPGSTSS